MSGHLPPACPCRPACPSWLALGLLLSAGLLPACSRPASEAVAVAAQPLEITVVRAEYRPIMRVLRVTGTLTADEEAEVAAEAAGRVAETPVERGTRVAAGAPLIRVVATEAEAQAKEAEANVAQIEVRLGLVPGEPFDVERMPEVMNARAARDLTRAEFGRIQALHEQRVVSRSEFDQRRTQVEVAERQYETARNSGQQLYRQYEAARARLTLAQKALGDTVVRAPFAGTVVERKVSVGDYVTRGLKVVTIVKGDPLRVELTVAEQDIEAVRPGQRVEVGVDAYPGRVFEGTVRYVSPSVRADQRALVVEAVLPNADGALKPGMFATAGLHEPEADRALLVPATAVRDLAGSQRIYVLKNGSVEERIVTLGVARDGEIEIVNGLAEGDQVATSQVDRLGDGTKVRVAGAAGPAAPAGKTGA